VRFLVAVAMAVASVVAGAAPAHATGGEPPDATAPASTANPFLPEQEDVSDCLSSLPPPDCGSDERGGSGQWLAFGAMMLGTVFIGWRIARAVRTRDRTVAADR
jgi:hypothetical protein